MYQDLKDQIPALVDALKTGVEYGGDLAHRFIMYDLLSNLGLWLFGGILIFASLRLCRKFKVAADKDHSDFNEGMEVVFFVATAGLSLTFVIMTPFLINLVVKDIYIPEVRIIEVLNDLLTPSKPGEI